MTAVLNAPKIESLTVPVNSLRVAFEGERKSLKNRRQVDSSIRIVTPDGQKLTVSNRFWTTFCQNFGFSRNIFDLFDYDEVLDRLGKIRKTNVRLAYESMPDKESFNGRLLSCTNPSRPMLNAEQVGELIKKYKGTKQTYDTGVVGVHFPAAFPMKFQVVGKQDSEFTTGHFMHLPLDGYGSPASYLELIRQVCTNGAVALTQAFRTSFSLGKDEVDLNAVLDRSLASFNDEEGYHAFKVRFETASRSYASLANMITLNRAISAAVTEEGWQLLQRVQLSNNLDAICGNPRRIHGLVSDEEVSLSRARAIPVKATVYELMNFATEVSTHHLKTLRGRNRINAWVGSLLTSPFDLENSVEQFPTFDAFLVGLPVGERSATAATKRAAKK